MSITRIRLDDQSQDATLTPAKVSTTITDNFVFPNNVTANADLIATTKVNANLVKGRTGDISLQPFANSVTGIALQNAAGTTTVLDVDTTNNRIGILTSAPTVAVQVGSNGTATGGSALFTTSDQTSAISGGSLTLTTGAITSGTSVTATGGGITLSTGANSAAGGSHTVGGSITLSSGTANLNSTGGGITLTSGTGSGTVSSGGITVTTGTPGGAAANGGSITLTTGSKTSGGTLTGGGLTLTSGTVTGGGSGPSVTGGSILLTSGNYSSGGAVNGGSITLTTGTSTGGGGSSNGGSITLTTGGGAGTQNAGNITLTCATPANGGSLFLTGDGSTTSKGNIVMGGGFIRPSADSVTAIRVSNAAQSTTVLDVDTTNSRVGIGNSAPTAALDVTGSAVVSVKITTPELHVVGGNKAIDLSSGTGRSLLTSAGTFVVDWQNLLLATSGGTSVDWGNRRLRGSTGGLRADWQTQDLHDSSAVAALNWTSRVLKDTAGTTNLTWATPGVLDVNSNRITSLADPTAAQDAATKTYVDSISAGLDPKASCRAATTANTALSGLLTIDTVVLVDGDRVLVKNQTTPSQNGIYNAHSSAWTRSTDMDGTPANEVSGGNFSYVEAGTQAGYGYVVVWDGNVVVGTDPINWTQFSAAGSYIAGNGIDITGSTISAKVDNITLDFTGSNLEVKTGGISNAQVNAAAAIDATKIADGSVTNAEFQFINTLTSNAQTQLNGKASTALDNLAAVAINTSLVSDTDNTDDLGSAAINWKDVHAKKLISSTAVTITASSGNVVLDPSGSNVVDVSTSKITNVVDPTAAQDAATKNYVDGASHSVAGANTQIQYNNAGAFGASAGLTWDNVGYALTLSSPGASGSQLYIKGDDSTSVGTFAIATDPSLGGGIEIQNIDSSSGLYFIGQGGSGELLIASETDTGYVVLKSNNTSPYLWTFDASGDLTAPGRIALPSGSFTLPIVTFTGDLDTGIFHPAANQFAIATGAAQRLVISDTQLSIGVQASVIDGSAAAPSWSFNNDLNTGLYRIGSDNIGISTAGTLKVNIDTAVTTTIPIKATVDNTTDLGSAAVNWANVHAKTLVSSTGVTVTATSGNVSLSPSGSVDVTTHKIINVVDPTAAQDAATKAYVDALLSAHLVTREVPSGTINGTNPTFTLAFTPVVGSETVFLNGLLQNEGAGNDYTISGATITFEAGAIPETGSVLLVCYRK